MQIPVPSAPADESAYPHPHPHPHLHPNGRKEANDSGSSERALWIIVSFAVVLTVVCAGGLAYHEISTIPIPIANNHPMPIIGHVHKLLYFTFGTSLLLSFSIFLCCVGVFSPITALPALDILAIFTTLGYAFGAIAISRITYMIEINDLVFQHMSIACLLCMSMDMAGCTCVCILLWAPQFQRHTESVPTVSTAKPAPSSQFVPQPTTLTYPSLQQPLLVPDECV